MAAQADGRVTLTGAPGLPGWLQTVFGGGSRAVRDVIVDGQILVRASVPTRLDPAATCARAAEELPRLLARAGIG